MTLSAIEARSVDVLVPAVKQLLRADCGGEQVSFVTTGAAISVCPLHNACPEPVSAGNGASG